MAALSTSRGGARNRANPLRRPSDTLLDIQAHRQELERDLDRLTGLSAETRAGLEILAALYRLAALIERPVQGLLEAERARLERGR